MRSKVAGRNFTTIPFRLRTTVQTPILYRIFSVQTLIVRPPFCPDHSLVSITILLRPIFGLNHNAQTTAKLRPQIYPDQASVKNINLCSALSCSGPSTPFPGTTQPVSILYRHHYALPLPYTERLPESNHNFIQTTLQTRTLFFALPYPIPGLTYPSLALSSPALSSPTPPCSTLPQP